MRSDESCCDATAELVAQQIGKCSRQGNVTGRERSCLYILYRGLLHRAVVHVLSCHTPCATLLISLHKRCRGRLCPLHVCHEVEVEALVRHVADERWIVEDERRVIVGDGDIVAAKSCYVGTHRQAQKAIHLLTFLTACHKGSQGRDDYQNTLFHH